MTLVGHPNALELESTHTKLAIESIVEATKMAKLACQGDDGAAS